MLFAYLVLTLLPCLQPAYVDSVIVTFESVMDGEYPTEISVYIVEWDENEEVLSNEDERKAYVDANEVKDWVISLVKQDLVFRWAMTKLNFFQAVVTKDNLQPGEDGSLVINAEIPDDKKNIEQPVVILLAFDEHCDEDDEPEVEVKGCLGWYWKPCWDTFSTNCTRQSQTMV